MASADFCDTTWNPIALDWAQACSPAPRRPVLESGVVWLRTWPPEAHEAFKAHDNRTAARRGTGFFDSTLDLRAGLSVIEVHAASPELAAALAVMADPAR
jgi:hypothetical protein